MKKNLINALLALTLSSLLLSACSVADTYPVETKEEASQSNDSSEKTSESKTSAQQASKDSKK